jgi:anti-sigma regulatory factor (Ser/Thr protein kinase)
MHSERQVYRANERELSPLLARVAEHAREMKLSSDLAHKLALILEELFLNTVHHGGGATGEPLVYLSIETTAETVQVVYEDNGTAYDPFATLDRTVLLEVADTRRIGGLGVLLVEGLASSARYARQGDCNRIELSFARAPPAR